MTHWKTTLAGICSVLVAVASAGMNLLNGQPVDFNALLAAVVAGFGLIFAADSKPALPPAP